LAIGFRLFQGIQNERHRLPAVSVGHVQQRGIGSSDSARKRYLRLDSRDAVDREPVLALEFPHEARQLGVEYVAHRAVAVLAPYVLQTLPQPAYISAMHPG
jgi:hypothetical protein